MGIIFRSLIVATCLWPLTTLYVVQARQPEELTDVIERCERSVVRIEVDSSEGAALGSGFIVSADGLLITNVHVLRGASRAFAVFPNGQRYEISGTLWVDESRDICITRIAIKDHPFLELASELPRKGTTVIALGSPKGLSFTATNGIVSAVRPAEELVRDMGMPDMRGTWIQVDAPLSGGNSGGPLINRDGLVVAMSTLASQGSAQNLNFGISAIDISAALKQASSRTSTLLADGVGKLKEAPGGPPSDRALINRPPVPRERIESYFEETRAAAKDLRRELSNELVRTNEIWKEMRKGDAFLPPGVSDDVDIVRVTRGRVAKYLFRSQAIKDREITRLQSRIRDLERLKESAKSSDDKTAIYELGLNYGPRLDTRRKGSVGFVSEAIVVHAFNEHDLLISLDDSPYLMWVQSSAGLSLGQEVMPGPVFVAGTQQVAAPGKPPMAVTVLNAVTEEELRAAFFGSANPDSVQWRIWRDATGKFEVEAQLVKVDSALVELKKRDGGTAKVPLNKLSKEDLEFLKKEP